MDLSGWREEYHKYSLKEADLPHEPIALFKSWFDQAIVDQNPEVNAMVLATGGEVVSARIVLLKEICEDQFLFYSNYASAKGQAIAVHPQVSLLFYWPMSQRQVRIVGYASQIDAQKSRDYFASRPIESQVSAIGSPQSTRIAVEELLARVEEARAQPSYLCPPHWGGYAVQASSMEFWQGGVARLHDRIVYEKTADNQWEIHRLAP